MAKTPVKKSDITDLLSINAHPTIAPLLLRREVLKGKQEALATALPRAYAAVHAAEQQAGALLASAVDEVEWQPTKVLVEAQAHAQALEQETRVVEFAVEALDHALVETTQSVRAEVTAALRAGAVEPLQEIVKALEHAIDTYADLGEYLAHCQRLLGGEASQIIGQDVLVSAQLQKLSQAVAQTLRKAQG